MADDPAATATPAATEPGAEDPKATTTPAAEPPKTEDPKEKKPAKPPAKSEDGDDDDEYSDMSEEDLRKALKGLRKEIVSKRLDNREAKEELAKLKKAQEERELEEKKKKGEWEKIAKDRESALEKANERAKRSELKAYAQKAGILDLSDVNNISLDGVTLDDATGDIHGAEKVINELKKSKPHWFKSAEADNKPKSTTSKVAEPAPGKGGPPDYSSMSNEDFAKTEREYLAEVKAKSR